MEITNKNAELAIKKGFFIEEIWARVFITNNVPIEDNTFSSEEYCDNAYRGNYYLSRYENTTIGFKTKSKRISYKYPTQDKLHKWLREKHGLHIIVIPTVTGDWTYKTVTVLSERDNDVILGIKSVSDLPPYTNVCGYDFSTYEDALEDGLTHCLTQINN